MVFSEPSGKDTMLSGVNTPHFAAGTKGKQVSPPTLERDVKRLAARKKASVIHYNKFLALMARGNWLYATRPNARGVVAVMTLVDTPDGAFLVFLKTRRPPMRGKINTEPVAGLWGDTDGKETQPQAAGRESEEEIGLKGQKPPLSLFRHPIPSSPGMTDEQTRYFFQEASLTAAQVLAIKAHKAEGDGDVIQGQLWIPLREFLDDPLKTLDRVAKTEGIPTKDMLSGMLLLLAHLKKTGRLRMEWLG
jgi:8-oxo-dGTP pyrophosphatase MutT (NUDIX family)